MKIKWSLLFSVAVILVVLFSSYFIVKETEQVVITRFGKPVRSAIKEAGLYFKIPLIDKANYFAKTILEWDGVVEESKPIPTKDKKNIVVDTTARWRITDALTFLQTVRSEEEAQSRLDDIIDSTIRDVISNHDLI
ncbi:MAG TPA: SPFH domain-containing protein, partial [bacterium]|nr:SPFH domain-containing protein [bacterium]